MKYNFDLSFDAENVPCFKFLDSIKEDEKDNLIEEYKKYLQEYKINIRKQLFSINWSYKPFNYRILFAGILMLITGSYLHDFDFGLWNWLIIFIIWMIFFKLMDKNK